MRKLALAIVLSLAFLSCENENESKYDKPTGSIDASGLMASFTFENDVVDHHGNYTITSPTNPSFKSSVNKTLALYLNSNDFVEFNVPSVDTFSFFTFFKSSKQIQNYGTMVRLVDIENQASVELDGVSGPTYLTKAEKKEGNILNTFNSWIFVYVELVKNSSAAKLVVQNKESSEVKTYEYNLDLNGPLQVGTKIRLGTSFNLQYSFTGLIDNLKMFNRKLSAADLDYFYKNR